MENNETIQHIYNKSKENIYLKYNIINFKEVEKVEDELIQLKEYLPNILRSVMNPRYYVLMEEYGVLDKVLEKMGETRKQTREENTIELINWVDTHSEYSQILDEEKIFRLGNELEELDNFYKK